MGLDAVIAERGVRTEHTKTAPPLLLPRELFRDSTPWPDRLSCWASAKKRLQNEPSLPAVHGRDFV